ncbi:MAG: 50S ribosomal protein L4 [Nitrospirota bacterium]
MPEMDVINTDNKKVGKITLNPEIFGSPVKGHLIHEVLVNQMANKRQGTAATKSKGMVRGGGAKPWKQKGTGRARAGSNRSPLWKGGGIVFGPHPRDYSYKVPKQVRWEAMNSAFSAKVASQDLVVVDKIDLPEPKTKIMASMLKKLGLEGSLLILTTKNERLIGRAARNIPWVTVKNIESLSLYDIVSHRKLLITSDIVKKIEEVFS